jgi:transposase
MVRELWASFYAKLQELLWELGTIEVGVGTLQKTNQRVAAAVKPAINALWEWAPLNQMFM